jgi:beta-1,4-mannosyl-glycoprotein beta-1,4-N-acetylglucosaminyltransferase
MQKIFDTFMFFNELDLLEIRLNILDPYVDYFVISESTVTFSGIEKPLLFNQNKERFQKFKDKIIYNLVDDTPKNFNEWTPPNIYYTERDKSYNHKSSGLPLKNLSLSFQREVYQRDSVINGLLGIASDDDIIIMSDLDEIPNPETLKMIFSLVDENILIHCKQKWYMYYLNNICDKDWYGTHVCKFKYLKKFSVDLLQYHKENIYELSGGPIIENGGWHFSFLGDANTIKQKLRAYSYQGGRTAKLLALIDIIFKNRIQKKLANNEDIFLTGRKFRRVPIDDSFPEFIRNNQDKYMHLLKR